VLTGDAVCGTDTPVCEAGRAGSNERGKEPAPRAAAHRLDAEQRMAPAFRPHGEQLFGSHLFAQRPRGSRLHLVQLTLGRYRRRGGAHTWRSFHIILTLEIIAAAVRSNTVSLFVANVQRFDGLAF